LPTIRPESLRPLRTDEPRKAGLPHVRVAVMHLDSKARLV
jgi:hypothetical protein